MHELAITQRILEIAIASAAGQSAQRITKIKLRIGQFTGVVRESIEFAFDAVKRGTIAEGAGLEIEMVQLRKRCPACNQIMASDTGYDFLCSWCKGPVEILSGRELQIEYIEAD
ncbi:MAG TPA: hydrogenase maturation nickel metallochaperone HypA [Blastocatellia bacterium]|nr:hydrogenase maturation nickel metallochaperone HypA [Blastocatellia bacterium]